MADASSDNAALFEALEALSESAFPKHCTTCGRVYESSEDFVRKSAPPANGSGLKASLDDDDRPLLELYRNCKCGSTLMDFFQDRRDTSAQGLRRRVIFSRVLDSLERKGMGLEEARHELIQVMHGKKSEKLESLGVRLRTCGE